MCEKDVGVHGGLCIYLHLYPTIDPILHNIAIPIGIPSPYLYSVKI